MSSSPRHAARRLGHRHATDARRRRSAALLRAGALCLVLHGGLAQAQGAAAPAASAIELRLPAGPLGPALTELALRTGLLIAADADLVRDRRAAALDGRYTPEQALAALLQGSGLVAERKAERSYTLRAGEAPASGAGAAAPAAGAGVASATGAGAAPVPRQDAGTLAEVRVSGAVDRDAPTEGTGLYTSEVTSSATRLDLSLRETPQSVTVLTRQRIEDQGMTQLADVFRQAPGVHYVQSGSQGTDSNAAYARGFEIENYQIDGIPQLGNWLNQTGELAIYDRVEIVRGATGLINGVGSPGAAINLVRKRPTTSFRGSAQVSLGSWKHRRAEVDLSTPITADGSVRGRVVLVGQNQDSWIDRLQEQKRVFYGIVEADLGPATRVAAGYEHQVHDADDTARGGAPLFWSDGSEAHLPRSTNSAAAWTYSYQTQRRLFVSLDHRFDNGWQARLAAHQGRRRYDDVVGYAARGTADRETGAGLGIWANRWNSEPKQNALDTYVSGPFELFGRRHELVAGLNVSRTTYTAPTYLGWPMDLPTIPDIRDWDGQVPAQPDLPRTGTAHFEEKQTGFYTTLRLRPTDSLSVIGGLRRSDWEQSTLDVPFEGDTSRTGAKKKGVLTPYLGVVADLNADWSAYVSYADIFKPSTNKDVEGNYLDPQEGKAYEIGAKATLLQERLNFSVAVFRIEQDNLPVWTGELVETTGESAYRAEKGTTTKGWEAELAGELMPGWQLGASYSHAVSRAKDGSRLNAQVPKDMFKLFSTYRFTQPAVQGLVVGGGLNWQSEIYADGVGPAFDQRFTQGRILVVDAMARYPFTDRLDATLNVWNLFDKRYYTTPNSSYYGAPRHAQVALRYRF